MTTVDEHSIGAALDDGTILDVKTATFKMDRGWAPYVQGTMTIPRRLDLDAVTEDHRVRVLMTQRFGRSKLASEISAMFPAATAAAMSTLYAGMTAAQVSALHFDPFNSFGVRASTTRFLDLTVRRVETGVRADETQIVLASDESIVQGFILMQTVGETFGSLSVRSIASQVLGRMGALLLDGTVDADIEFPVTWEPGVSAWDFLAPIVQQSGLRLWADGRRVWRLDVDETPAVGSITLDGGDRVIDASLSTDVERGGWADAVVIRYQWRDEEDVEHVKYDIAGTNKPRNGILISYTDTVYPGYGAAAQVLRRRQRLGRSAPIAAVADYSVEPGMGLTISLADTPAQTGQVQSVEWRYPELTMTVEPAELAEGA